jgi:hypothetical protein
MLRWEPVVLSMIGTLSGGALGVGIGLARTQALKVEGIKAASIPVPQVPGTSCSPQWPERWPHSDPPGPLEGRCPGH